MDITNQQPKYYDSDEDEFLDESIKKKYEKNKKVYQRRMYCLDNNICYYCDKTYSTRSSLKRHTRICKELKLLRENKKQKEIEKKEIIIQKQQERLEHCELINKKLKEHLSTKEFYYKKIIKLLEDNIDKLVLQKSQVS